MGSLIENPSHDQQGAGAAQALLAPVPGVGAIVAVLWSVMLLSAEQRETIITWAERNPKIGTVFLLGSRAHGSANLDSDIELGVSLAGGSDSWWGIWVFINNRRAWRAELEKALGLKVHLQLESGGPAGNVLDQIEVAHVTLWRRV
jgi:predicted nucleotidyltransferase